MALVLITAFEVAPEADERFMAERERGAALYRALRVDVALRFVEIARLTEPDADRAPAPPFAAHTALYDVVRSDGDLDGAGGAVLISPFEVPAGEDDRFLAGWERLRELFAARQGHLGTRLHRSRGPADFRYVGVVRWSSPLMYARTMQEPEPADATAALPFPGRPALYLRIED
jgi:hypothetical protein